MRGMASYFPETTMHRISSALAVLLFAGVNANAADWYQFLGPNRDGVSPETGLANSWPDGGPKELWEVKVGGGFGGPAIRGDEVYVLDREPGSADVLRVLNLKSGKELWTFRYPAKDIKRFTGSRSVPTVTDTHVYIVGGQGDLTCVDRSTHKEVWQTNLGKAYVPGTLN